MAKEKEKKIFAAEQELGKEQRKVSDLQRRVTELEDNVEYLKLKLEGLEAEKATLLQDLVKIKNIIPSLESYRIQPAVNEKLKITFENANLKAELELSPEKIILKRQL